MDLQKEKQYIIPGIKVSDVLLENQYLILMLEHFGLQLEVQEKTIAQLCSENNISIELFIAVANLYNGHSINDVSNYSFNIVENIISYLKNSHTYYLNEKYPEVQKCITKISFRDDHSEITMVDKFFKEYFEEVEEHLDYENKTVFPYVLNLLAKIKNLGADDANIVFSAAEYSEHHNDIEEKLTDLKNLLIKYLPTNNDQKIRRELLFHLFELEHDLKIHSFIEDKILIPLVKKMEQHLKELNEK